MTTQVAPELDAVRSEVREHYAQRAQTAGASCCGPSTGPSTGSSSGAACCSDEKAPLYDSADLTLVPDEMSGMSWGCGNPTAIAALKPGEVVLDLERVMNF